MSNTTFSLMSYPMLDITLKAYHNLKLKYVERINVIKDCAQYDDEQNALHSKIATLDELINAILSVQGCMDQNING